MRTIRATIRFAIFIIITFGSPILRFVGQPVVRLFGITPRRWREMIFKKWAQGFVRIANLKLVIQGEPPQPPFLLVSNHVSYMDIAALRSQLECVFVAKADIAEWFLAGSIVRAFGTIFINRENRRDIPRAGAEVIRAIERGEGVVIFAEGTTGNGIEVLPFKSSFLEFAAAANVPVYYASIRYQTPEDEEPASEVVCWWRMESGFGEHLFNLFKLPEFYGTLTFGAEPIQSRDRKKLANDLREAVSEQLDVQ